MFHFVLRKFQEVFQESGKITSSSGFYSSETRFDFFEKFVFNLTKTRLPSIKE